MTSREPGNYFVDVFPKSFSADEWIFLNSMFDYFSDVRSADKSQEILVDVSAVPEFKDLNAYDIYTTGKYRNELADWLKKGILEGIGEGSDMRNILSPIGAEVLRRFNELLLEYLKVNLDIDLSVDLVVKFPDGSMVVYEVRVDNGGHPNHLRDDPRNIDANHNPILGSNTPELAGDYLFEDDNQLQDFTEAAQIYGIPVTTVRGNGIIGGGVKASCHWTSRHTLECVAKR